MTKLLNTKTGEDKGFLALNMKRLVKLIFAAILIFGVAGQSDLDFLNKDPDEDCECLTITMNDGHTGKLSSFL